MNYIGKIHYVNRMLLLAFKYIVMATYPYFSAGLVCPNGITTHGGTCYSFHYEPKTWDEARSWCKKTNGADLLIIRNDDVYNHIKGHLLQTQGILIKRILYIILIIKMVQ